MMVCLYSGLFFIIPCTDTYTKVDLRTVSFDVPPQEVKQLLIFHSNFIYTLYLY